VLSGMQAPNPQAPAHQPSFAWVVTGPCCQSEWQALTLWSLLEHGSRSLCLLMLVVAYERALH
jgi:hypothetical protein